ncbi:ECF transporter S component [Mycoplasmopsis fermentans]|uniref:ECF transporter S component n=1 Tax=Mycoplasmopsis fermentans TaxID=2115 RepID=UPI0001E32F2A|nr:ECF transporter S component [Mycoplasmopsis fermentans]ADN69188.1 conserved hypothetical membrane spanning protein [Mycoplasmopsis fermentans JER]RMX35059.1 hypothetical protein MFI1_0604 [Mycoplasmopsis fermentans MF-I1]RMX35230.1 hypothetical protein MFI2_0582 [Mycoplasmopsis fermentans MF-I2]
MQKNENFTNNIAANEDDKSFNELSFGKKFKQHFAKSFRLSVLDIALAGILLAIHFVVAIISKFTILKIIPLETDAIFFILYGIFFGPLKGSLISFLADTFMMLLTGTIGTWYYLYALIPIGICILSSFYYFFYRASFLFRIIFPIIVISVGFALLLYVVINSGNDKGYHIKGIKKLKYLPKNAVLWMLLIYFNFSVIAFIFIIFQLLFAKNKKVKKRWFDYLFVFSIIIFIMIIFRWLIGPYVYINYYNYLYAGRKSLNYTGEHYYLITIPILLKSLITIPIYSIIMNPIFSVVILLKEKFVEKNSKISY